MTIFLLLQAMEGDGRRSIRRSRQTHILPTGNKLAYCAQFHVYKPILGLNFRPFRRFQWK
jgi:hypothetical protein